MEFVKSQFSYGRDIIEARYFNKWGIIVCFLNRLKLVDEQAFEITLQKLCPAIILQFSTVPIRDVHRLEMATHLSKAEFEQYYQESKTSENAY